MAAATSQPCRSWILGRHHAESFLHEVTPGNQLELHNYGKLQTFYWTIKELGHQALSNEDGWWPLTTIRSSTVSMLKHALSQVAKNVPAVRNMEA